MRTCDNSFERVFRDTRSIGDQDMRRRIDALS